MKDIPSLLATIANKDNVSSLLSSFNDAYAGFFYKTQVLNLEQDMRGIILSLSTTENVKSDTVDKILFVWRALGLPEDLVQSHIKTFRSLSREDLLMFVKETFPVSYDIWEEPDKLYSGGVSMCSSSSSITLARRVNYDESGRELHVIKFLTEYVTLWKREVQGLSEAQKLSPTWRRFIELQHSVTKNISVLLNALGNKVVPESLLQNLEVIVNHSECMRLRRQRPDWLSLIRYDGPYPTSGIDEVTRKTILSGLRTKEVTDYLQAVKRLVWYLYGKYTPLE